jgi:hypothetical protein
MKLIRLCCCCSSPWQDAALDLATCSPSFAPFEDNLAALRAFSRSKPEDGIENAHNRRGADILSENKRRTG